MPQVRFIRDLIAHGKKPKAIWRRYFEGHISYDQIYKAAIGKTFKNTH